LQDGDDTPSLALLLTESAGWRRQRERARSKRNENFSAIIHYAPLGGHYARLRQGQKASEFLMTGSAVDPVIDCQNWRTLLDFRFWPISAGQAQ
jgi:hypothetical protein